MKPSTRVLAMLGAAAAVLALPRLAQATTCTMTPWSGSDGPFTVVSESGHTVNQANGSPGSYAAFMYFQHPSGCSFASGATLYAEIDYLDVSGEPLDAAASGGAGQDAGNIGLQYDAKATLGNAFQNAGFVLDGAVLGTGQFKTAVSRLDQASFSLDENGGNDMRLVQNGSFQLNVVQVRVSDQPTALYTQDTAFLGPYAGPTYAGGTPVDASTLAGKLVCGYQGWYGAPGDEDNLGWSHWSSAAFSLTPSTLQIDPWPDLSEFTPAEQFPVPGFTLPEGGTAPLFSSDVARTVLRHFQWMEAWDIDGAAVQRFVVSLPNLPLDRVLTNVRQAANETGRVYYVEYDMSGMTEADIVPAMTADWHYLIDTLKIASDSRYLHHDGLPVVGIFGFYPSRFSSTTANAILDVFSSAAAAPYRAFVEGAGDWTWRTSWAPDWIAMLYRMGAWQPWNVGNVTGATPDYAATAYWTADQAQLQANQVMYVPEIYPGSSSVNRDMAPPGSGLPRLAGRVLWNEFAAASSLGAASAFLGMFDEVSEGTQIVKVTNSPPTQAPNPITYEGMPSDAYLCFTSQGSQMLKGKIPSTTPLPNCPAMTQPTIPDPIAPLDGAVVHGPAVNLSWSAAMALAGGGSLTTYQTWVDGTVHATTSLSLGATTNLPSGTHVWRVRAVNSLGNSGGWSVAQTFTVGSSSLDGGASADGAAASDASVSTDGSTSSPGAGADSGGALGGSPSSSSAGCACTESSRRGALSDGFAWTAIAWALGSARRRRSGSPRPRPNERLQRRRRLVR
jgi:hypothetical protein